MKILAFGIAKDIVEGPELELPVNMAENVGALRKELNKRFPRLLQLSSYLIAVNDEYAEEGVLIHDRDEIAIIPPVSGG